MSLVKRALRKLRTEGVSSVAQALYERARDHLTPHPIKTALTALESQPVVSIIQIGAYVGDEPNDPLKDFLRRRAVRPGLTAVLVEPVRDYFERLRKNYAGLPGVHYENSAVSDVSGEREFYRLGVDPRLYGMPEWLEQLGSLRADRMEEMWDRQSADNHIKVFWLKHRVIERVNTIAFSDLLQKYAIQTLDLLQVDTEGSDYDILRTIDLTTVRPRFINYERILLGDREQECREMLRNAGYSLSDHGQDTFCRLVH